MPTDTAAAPALFLFAHQDDEFGVFDEIARATRSGAVTCAFLTDGAAAGEPRVRNRESANVLVRLGVAPDCVRFLGEERGIADGRLLESLPAVATAVGELLDALPRARVYVPAWEGGHPDHDGLHAVIAQLLHERGRLADARQFPLYHGQRRPGPWFRVLSPLTANGAVKWRRLPLRERLRQLRLCLSYPSQTRTWLGLFPFVAAHLAFAGRQSLQCLDLARIAERPHPGRLYYEKRGFATYELVHAAIDTWRASRDIPAPTSWTR